MKIPPSFHPLWKGSEVLEAIHGQGPSNWKATGLSIDTRTLQPGDLFIALRGQRFDAHAFVSQALEKGACAAIVQHGIMANDGHRSTPLIGVPDPFEALCHLAERARQRFQGKILALTGSVGKTTTKEGLKHALSSLGAVFASPESFNNHIGVPLSLAQLPPETPYGIFELGMNHSGEIQALTQLVQPHCAMITNVSYQHGVNFDSIHDIALAKGEIFSAPSTRLGILYHDSPHFSFLQNLGQQHGIQQWITFGLHKDASVRLLHTQTFEETFQVHTLIQGEVLTYTLPRIGAHWVTNSLSILAGALALGADVFQAAQSLASFYPLPGRGQRLNIAGITVIDDSYNAAYESTKAALTAFAREEGKKYILLGEMLELGEQSLFYHQELLEPLICAGAHGIWLCGPGTKVLLESLPETLGYSDQIDTLIPEIIACLKPGDTLLVKGSRGTKTFRIIDALYRHYGLEEQARTYPLRPYLSI